MLKSIELDQIGAIVRCAEALYPLSRHGSFEFNPGPSPHTTLLPARSATAFCTKYIATSVMSVVVTTT